MKLPYGSIFRSGGSGEDATIAACGLPNAFMRLLFSLVDFPHTFWDNGERVTLSDSERQLIEVGQASLSTLFAKGGCTLRVLTAVLPAALVVTPGGEALMEWSVVYSEEDYVSYDNGGNFSFSPGEYTFFLTARINSGLSPGSNWRHRFRLRRSSDGVALRVWEFVKVLLDDSYTMAAHVVNPGVINFTWENFSASNAGLNAGTSSTRLEVIRIG